MKKDILQRIIRDFHAAPPADLHRRDLGVPTGSGKIVSVVGPRRSGKTSLLLTLMEALAQGGVNRTSLLYLNFEDERLDFRTEELDLIIQAYLELYPTVRLDACHLFFDEIQNVPGWDRFVRRLYDTVTRNIYLTGSNARFLSSEIATSLRGRTVSYEVLPLSFREYLRFRTIAADTGTTRALALVRRELERFLTVGGFPEVIGYEEDFRNRVLQEYFNVMIYRDLLERYEIDNLPALKFFLKRLCAAATKPFSVNAIYNDLKSSGFKLGKNQLYDWLEACRNIHLAFVLRKPSAATVNRELGEKKVYLVDNGLVNAVSYRFSEDRGKALEQAVYLELRRRGKDVFFFRGKGECDFVIRRDTKVVEAIQVSASLDDPETRRREERGLVEACRAFGLKRGTIISGDSAEVKKVDGISIQVVPAVFWLLG
jgi:predicted AAA+ superfamily ATPase